MSVQAVEEGSYGTVNLTVVFTEQSLLLFYIYICNVLQLFFISIYILIHYACTVVGHTWSNCAQLSPGPSCAALTLPQV